MEQNVSVICDHKSLITKKQIVTIEKDQKLNDFRRKCSKVFNQDITSVFARNGRRISDMSEVETEKEVIVSTHFYLKYWNSDKYNHSNFGELDKFTFRNNEKGRITANVEIFGRSNTGKTALLQKLLQNESQNCQRSSVKEAVYHQQLDIQDQIVEFILTDTNEKDIERTDRLKDGEFIERIIGKQVILIFVSKQEVIEKVINNKFDDIRNSVMNLVSEIRRHNADCLIMVVLCKYDIISDCESQINELLKTLPSNIKYIKTSTLESTSAYNVKNAHQLFTLIGQALIEQMSSKKNSSNENSARPTIVFREQVQNPRQLGIGQVLNKMRECFHNVCG